MPSPCAKEHSVVTLIIGLSNLHEIQSILDYGVQGNSVIFVPPTGLEPVTLGLAPVVSFALTFATAAAVLTLNDTNCSFR